MIASKAKNWKKKTRHPTPRRSRLLRSFELIRSSSGLENGLSPPLVERDDYLQARKLPMLAAFFLFSSRSLARSLVFDLSTFSLFLQPPLFPLSTGPAADSTPTKEEEQASTSAPTASAASPSPRRRFFGRGASSPLLPAAPAPARPPLKRRRQQSPPPTLRPSSPPGRALQSTRP